jgi:hypothetical protein
LIATVVGTLHFFLFLSAGINVVAFLYIRNMLQELETISNDLLEISTSLNTFSDHVEKVYSMETFYGDPTLQGLLEHSQHVIEDIDNYISKQYYEEHEIEEHEIEEHKIEEHEIKETDFNDEEPAET